MEVVPIGTWSIRIAIVASALLMALVAAGSATAKPINENTIWQQRWSKTNPAERAWVHATGECESGNNPTTDTGNGFLGAHQWQESTWWDAPATGPRIGEAHELPNLEPLKVQNVVAIKYARRYGTNAWPVCG